jgi:hypothetical protein
VKCISEVHGSVTGVRYKRNFDLSSFVCLTTEVYSLQHSSCYRISSSYQQTGQLLSRIINSNTYKVFVMKILNTKDLKLIIVEV